MTQQLLNLDHDRFPTTTVHQARLQLAQPTRRPKDMARVIDTPWGHGTVTGKYGQVHVSFIEGIFCNAEKKRRDDDGGIELLVDPYKVRMTTGGNKQMSWQQMQIIKTDVMRVVIDLRGNQLHRPITGHIIDLIVESKVKATSRPGTIHGDDRWLWYVKLGPAFVRFIDDDWRLYYDPAPIAQLNAGISQAIVRHVLTHSSEPLGGWKIDELIKTVGGGGTSKAMWERRNEIREDEKGLLVLKIAIENDRIRRL